MNNEPIKDGRNIDSLHHKNLNTRQFWTELIKRIFLLHRFIVLDIRQSIINISIITIVIVVVLFYLYEEIT
jgi:phage-related holin